MTNSTDKTLCLIIGLGNPGRAYETTRHSIGKLFLDYLAGEGAWQTEKKASAEIIKKNGLIIAKSSGYMNESGLVVKKIIGFFKSKDSKTLIVHDDSDLIFGKCKLVDKKSSAAGHHGVESIGRLLGQGRFSRLRIGIRPKAATATGLTRVRAESFVLKKFSKKDLEILEKEIFPKAKELFIEWIERGK